MKRLIVLLFCACSASKVAPGAASDFLLGVDYSEWAPNAQIATDGAGFLYLSTQPITKLTPDGKTIVWQSQPGTAGQAMTVDPNGGVYFVTNLLGTGPQSLQIAKLNPTGQGIAWTKDTGLIVDNVTGLAADSSGRVYMAANSGGGAGAVVVARLNAAGMALDYTTYIPGVLNTPTSIAVDSRGNAYVAGLGGKGVFLAQFAADGSAGFYSSATAAGAALGYGAAPTVALDTNGEEVVYAAGNLLRFDATGKLTFSKTVSNWEFNTQGLLVDSAGNAYISGSTNSLVPLRNTLVPCETELLTMALLSVIARDGTVLQTTYIPEARGGSPNLAMGPNSDVFVTVQSDVAVDASFTPTQSGPFNEGLPATASLLVHLTPNAKAAVFPLGCMGNAATYQAGPVVAPGEIVTLMGSGLGPQQGVQTQASVTSPFPTTVQNVQVTFDGTPAPLLWVQDGQINAIAPWSGGTTVCVLVSGIVTNCLSERVQQTWPAVFTVDGYHAAALNQDSTVNSAANPAAPGSIVSVFAAGMGPISPAQADGSLVQFPLPVNVLPVAGFRYIYTCDNVLECGGPTGKVAVNVTYAGPAPYLVAGVTQINFTVQTSGTPGPFNPDSYCVGTGPGSAACFGIFVRLGP